MTIKKENIKQILMFLIVGCSNTLVGYLSYVFFLFILTKFSVLYDYFLANVLSFVLSIQWAYYFNKRFVFDSVNKSMTLDRNQLLKTYITYCISGLFVNNILLYLFIDIIEVSKYIAPILNLFILVPFNFLINKFWVFKKSGSFVSN